VLGFLGRRLGHGAIVVAIVATVCFALIHLAPGDPFGSVLDDPHVTPALRAEWRARAGLDRPLAEQYVRFVANLARGDLGISYVDQRRVGAILAEALPRTLLLMGTGIAVSFVAGVLLGVLQAVHRGRPIDRVLGGGAALVGSLPEFWLALILLLAFAYGVRLFPASGMVDGVMHDYMSPMGKLLDYLRHLALPVSTFTLLTTASVARLQRSAMLGVLPDDYVRTARAKGLSERRVIFRHALRNALLPTITLVGLAAPALVAGAVFIESIFSWPGMGLVAVRAVQGRDYHLVMASVLLGSTLVVIGGIVADVLQRLADPRTRTAE
jgi:peptide/nickel transport system permease protein